METSVQVLSQLISVSTKSDTTKPPCWETDIVLRFVERLLVHQLRQPRMFAMTCKSALEGIKEPTVRALIRLGVINGLRRDDGVSAERVSALFTQVRQEIDALPGGIRRKSSRRRRCLGFWLYQAGVWYSRNGFYAQAAEVHAEAADLGASRDEKAISVFLARLYRLWYALVQNQGVEECLALLRDELPKLQEGVAGTKVDVLWGHANGPLHILQAMVLSQKYGDEWAGLLAQLRLDAPQLPQAFAPWVQMLDVMDLLLAAPADNAVAIQQMVAELLSGDASPAIKAHTRLLLARLYSAIGQQEKARSEYQAIIPGPDYHMVAAVAARELAALDG